MTLPPPPSKPRPQPVRGEVWLVDFPNRPNDPHLPRPAIIISNNLINKYAEAVLAIPVSSAARGKLLPTHVPIPTGTGGLIKDSRAMCEQIASIDKSCLGKAPLGSIPQDMMQLLVKALNKSVE